MHQFPQVVVLTQICHNGGNSIQSNAYVESIQSLLCVTVLIILAFCPLLKLSLLSGEWEELSIKRSSYLHC